MTDSMNKYANVYALCLVFPAHSKPKTVPFSTRDQTQTDRRTDRHTETRTVFFFSESHASESYLAIPSLDTKFSLCVCSGELTIITEQICKQEQRLKKKRTRGERARTAELQRVAPSGRHLSREKKRAARALPRAGV